VRGARTNAVAQSVVVRDSLFTWRVHREPQWCTSDGWKGLAVLVERVDGGQRVLIVEFPFEAQTRRSTPHRQRPFVSQKQLEDAITAALDAGWDPEKRGKPYVFEVR
jgi:hypothetical protein